MIYKKNISEIIFDIINYIFMVFLLIITLYPMLYVAFASISDPVEMASFRGVLLKPLGFSIEAYKAVFRNPSIISGYANTIFYVIVGTCINIIMTSMGAYVISQKDLYWRGFITFIIVFTMFFNGGLIPTYLLIKSLGMLDTRLALVIPGAISVWNLLVMKTSFEGIPTSLFESAKMDGANDFKILFRIVFPLSLPVIAVMILFYGVGHWNSWFSAMIYLRDRNLYPLQLILREILIANDTNMMIGNNVSNVGERELISVTIQYATIMVATIPILFIYPFLQKYFVKGILIGAIKE